MTRNPLDPEAEECVPAAWDHASEETSGYMDTPEHTFDMELVEEERDKKTEVSDEENDEGELDEDRNRESELSDAQLGKRKLGENADIQGNTKTSSLHRRRSTSTDSCLSTFHV